MFRLSETLMPTLELENLESGLVSRGKMRV